MRHMKSVIASAAVLAALSVGWESGTPPATRRVDFGKIYLTPTNLFVGEIYRGINIFDVRSPAAIRSVGYITLEGNNDVAVTGTILYADAYRDLLVYDLSDPAHPALVDSIPDVFTAAARPSPVTQTVVEDSYGGVSGCSGSGCGDNSAVSPNVYDNAGRGTGTGSSGGQTGQAGSMARFAIVGDVLYCIDQVDLVVFNIGDPRAPKLLGKAHIGFGIETLFPYEDYLFVGSSTGMYIYDARDIRIPVQVSQFRHARACDPVVVSGTRAYVTLRTGPVCGPAEDALHIVDISDLTNPSLLSTYPMDSPQGLALNDGIAYVCDASCVRILDVTDELAVREITRIPLSNGYDAIYSDGLLYIVWPNGIAIYDVHDPANPKKLTTISTIG